MYDSSPLTVNDADATERVPMALEAGGTLGHVPPAPLGQRGLLAASRRPPAARRSCTTSAAPTPRLDAEAVAALERGALPPGTVMNHSPRYAPPHPTPWPPGSRHLQPAPGSG
ncbi:hypothetical protein LV779_12585 [Streptomyces thinghirensis]|nr:hypothetical protein [Streptomyces thinghirensis]